jgi:hypothetical protein
MQRARRLPVGRTTIAKEMPVLKSYEALCDAGTPSGAGRLPHSSRARVRS